MPETGSGGGYDVVVIGGGPPGENVAARVAAAGLSAVLVEHELVGGECSFWACMPSKVLLRPAEVMAATRRLPGVTGSIDPAAVFGRRDAFVHAAAGQPFGHDDGDQAKWLDGAGVALVRGHARLAGVDLRSAHRSGRSDRRSAEPRGRCWR